MIRYRPVDYVRDKGETSWAKTGMGGGGNTGGGGGQQEKIDSLPR